MLFIYPSESPFDEGFIFFFGSVCLDLQVTILYENISNLDNDIPVGYQKYPQKYVRIFMSECVMITL